ncbi:MAG: hypothetical protein CL916_11025 [Deltaproteobacteria bacterium]|nr:hypothetical protein [Deltaproteobacteria bacterium]
MLSDFIEKAKYISALIKNEDVLICWNVLLLCPEEMAFLDDWIDYLYDERGCSGFNFLNMDIVYNEKRDEVVVSFLREKHSCNRFILLTFLKELRSKLPIQVEMRG